MESRNEVLLWGQENGRLSHGQADFISKNFSKSELSFFIIGEIHVTLCNENMHLKM